jgi:hypothetical protein
MRRLRKFIALPLQQKWLFAKAWCLLLAYRLALVFVPLKRITRTMNHSSSPQSMPALTPDQQAKACEVGQLVAHAAVATPWSSRCLVQVLVVQRLLVASGIPGQFFLGVNRAGAGAADSLAHAWLICGDTIVSGEPGSEQFSVVSSYAW